jgi:hypothetical protein
MFIATPSTSRLNRLAAEYFQSPLILDHRSPLNLTILNQITRSHFQPPVRTPMPYPLLSRECLTGVAISLGAEFIGSRYCQNFRQTLR